MQSIKDMIKKNDTEGIIAFMQEYDLTLKDGKIIPNSPDAKARIIIQRDFYDQRQLIKKILLNS